MTGQPNFWLLNRQLGWRLTDEDGNAAGDAPVIRLGASADGPLALNSTDGSLGGLVLPRGMAIDDTGIVYLLGTSQAVIKRFDAATRKFAIVPGFGGTPSDPRHFSLPAAIAIAGSWLYVADRGKHRVAVFALGDLGLRHVWRRRWDPIDIAARGNCAYILDASQGRVYRHCLENDRLRLVIARQDPLRYWTRIALDRDGRIYLLDSTLQKLDIFDASGTPAGSVSDNSAVSGSFDTPLIRLDSRGRFRLPPLPCVKTSDLLFTRDGDPATIEPAESPGPAPYKTAETWISEPLDSKIYRCQWHRIELQLAALPPGTRATVSTFTSADTASGPNDYLWETRYTLAGPSQTKPGASTATNSEFLVQSHEGQYLWLRLQLAGDGFASPEVASIRAHFPRESYLAYLPAVYQADDESRWFLERFLSIAQTRWDQLEYLIDNIAAYFDPKAVPPKAFLAYLARWLALPLEGTWTEKQKRTLLVAAPQFYRRRGTIESLKAYLRVYLQNLSGATDAQMELVDYPQLLENFRERRYFMLSSGNSGAIGGASPMWGPGVTERCQLDVFSQVGDVRMISTGDPEHDVFQHFAHRFRVFIPAAWVRGAEDERKIRRALDTEKPAHTEYDLCLIEPRFRVGVQSTVGIDTVIGARPLARLGGANCADQPESGEPTGRLGYDMVLGARQEQPRTFPLAPVTRLGIDTTLK